MKILFTLLSIKCDNNDYLESAKKLINEILIQTTHDVLLTTNDLNYFSDINNKRFIIRDNIKKDEKLKFEYDFNYNLKHYAFKNIPVTYDFIIYLDCDIKLDGWTLKSEKILEEIMYNKDFGATRLNCTLLDNVLELKQKNETLFKHKIISYNILNNYSINDDIMFSNLPSEHFLIFSNYINKLDLFQSKWEEMNDYLISINGEGGVWGDGFEIGISARYAGFKNIIEIDQGIWDGDFGFKFNGNK